MKSGLLSIFTITLLTLALPAQIPNSGFENWTGTEPDGWSTTNVPGFAYPVQQSSISYSGSSSVKCEIVTYFGFAWPANLLSNFAVSQRHAAFTGYYQFYPMASIDSIFIVVGMYKDGMAVGAGNLTIGTQASSWTPFSVDILYGFGEIPDSAFIFMEFPVDSSSVIGSHALFDDLAFMGISDIQKKENPNLVEEFQLKQNYPNPFNPTTNIEFSIPQSSNVKLVVYNQLGQAVATLVNERLSSGIYSVDWNAEGFPSGIYFYEMTAGDFSKTMKLILMR